jgi:hypothetical protein
VELISATYVQRRKKKLNPLSSTHPFCAQFSTLWFNPSNLSHQTTTLCIHFPSFTQPPISHVPQTVTTYQSTPEPQFHNFPYLILLSPYLASKSNIPFRQSLPWISSSYNSLTLAKLLRSPLPKTPMDFVTEVCIGDEAVASRQSH